ncbi:hypothetical protein CVT25_000625 [Psilocybe cyanescens]|uniref:Uncharacterized protein n=1 Tax=Psilocybe cyanescens TaxID=93625 RepID=A0A409XUI9_PSICY|nr:hypothetical protein CVT25_000625 [Psilocybe cyanescens]
MGKDKRNSKKCQEFPNLDTSDQLHLPLIDLCDLDSLPLSLILTMGKDKRNSKKCQLSTSVSEVIYLTHVSQQNQMQISDPDDYIEVDDEDSNSGLQSNIRKPNPPVKPTYKQSGHPSKRDQKSRTDPIPDDQNMAASQFLQPVTPPQKVDKKVTSINQYTPQTAQAV